MSKVSGTYPSLSRGVNQQPMEARLDGQHGEQVNMWSDPVNGLSRRRGTVLQSRWRDNVFGPSYHQMFGAQQDELREYFASYRTVPYVTDGLEMLVHYPTKPQPEWMRTPNYGPSGGIKVSRKLPGTSGIEQSADIEMVGYGNSGDPEYTVTKTLLYKGIATACQVGRYMLFVPNDIPFSVPEEVDAWDSLSNKAVALEVKQGLPNRAYTVKATVDGTPYTWTYDTPSSAYSGTLSTSDIPYTDPEYQKKVNDRVNAYNSAVTAWITTAASQTRPSYIADRLKVLMAGTMAAIGATITSSPTNGSLVINIPGGRAYAFSTTDGGDNSNFITTGDTVTSTDDLTSTHATGKIVRVKPERGTESFYVKAVPTDTGGKVRWEECARTSQSQIGNGFLVMAVKLPQLPFVPRVAVARGTPSGLLHLATMLGDPTVQELPTFNGRLVGDVDSSPPPKFFGKQVSWIGMFQDRLCIAAGNTIDMSEVGNYFNFFRTETLTVPDTDPVGIFALGGREDVIRHHVIFDKSLLLFGDNQQYSIDGRSPVTPSTTTVIQSSAIEGAADCAPVAGGSLVFFGKRREDTSEIFQLQVGDVADTSNFECLGLQLSDYLPGYPTQILHVSSPSMLFVRCSEAPHSVFVFKFIDQNKQRVMDSWSRFDYHPAFGIIYGMFHHNDSVYYRVAREAVVIDDKVWTGGDGEYGFDVIERQSLLSAVSGFPYLDSMRPQTWFWNVGPGAAEWYGDNYPFLATVFARDIIDITQYEADAPKFQYWLHGVTPNVKTPTEMVAQFSDIASAGDYKYCVMGIPFDSYVELTSPIRKDNQQQPMLEGRLTVNRLDVRYKNAGGFDATVTTNYGEAMQYNSFDWEVTTTPYGKVTALKFNGRTLNQASNMVGIMPIATGTTPVFIGREAQEYTCKIGSRSWMPLSITRVSWTGQWFMNHRHV